MFSLVGSLRTLTCGRMSLTPRRARNARGSGVLLRQEIVDGARRLLQQGVGPEALTLRAVAREVGIAAPSIYAHFDDVTAIVRAVLVQTFAELEATVHAAIDPLTDPVERLIVGCRAYVTFAEQHSDHYRMLFGRTHVRPADEQWDNFAQDELGGRAFYLLVDAMTRCVETQHSSSTDPFADSVSIWSFLHGFALLRIGLAVFPWPDPEVTFAPTLLRLASVPV